MNYAYEYIKLVVYLRIVSSVYIVSSGLMIKFVNNEWFSQCSGIFLETFAVDINSS